MVCEHTTQHETRGMRHATRDMQHATRNTQRAPYNTHHAPIADACAGEVQQRVLCLAQRPRAVGAEQDADDDGHGRRGLFVLLCLLVLGEGELCLCRLDPRQHRADVEPRGEAFTGDGAGRGPRRVCGGAEAVEPLVLLLGGCCFGQCSLMRCNAMRCDAVRCDAMRCDAMRCDAM